MNYDVIIIGTGISGLYCALNIEKTKNILLITKDEKTNSNSYLAQGGVSVQRSDDDFESFVEDTLKAGHYENKLESVSTLVSESRQAIKSLMSLGVEFTRNKNKLIYTKEGAHSTNRIVYHEDLTGKEITDKLLLEVSKRSNITILEHTKCIDLISKNNTCYGIVVSKAGNIENFYSNFIVLATGGIGGLFKNSTNQTHLTGDGLSLSLKHNIKLKNIGYVQIHPTALFSSNTNKRRFLITESLRGEGAILINSRGERFVDELLPRDIVSNAIFREMRNTNSNCVFLKADFLGSDFLEYRFPNIVKICLEEGYDIRKEPIPVSPAQHYFMGGIEVDLDGKTSMNNLFACGETACTGVHGKNRLASNSLLEALVFSNRIAKYINTNFKNIITKEIEYTASNSIDKNEVINLLMEEGEFLDESIFKI